MAPLHTITVIVDNPAIIEPKTPEWQKMARNGRDFHTPATIARPIRPPMAGQHRVLPTINDSTLRQEFCRGRREGISARHSANGWRRFTISNII